MKITETPNTKAKLDIRKMAMSCDDNGHEVPAPLQKGNFFYIVVGQPSSGKTNLWLNFIKKRKCFYHKQFHKIYIFSNSLHTIKEKINLPKEQLVHGFDLERLTEIITEEQQQAEEEDANKCLIIFDDIVAQITKNLPPMLKLLYNRRHIGGGISILLTTQKFTKIPLELRTVATGVFFFHTKNKTEIETLFDEYGNMKKINFYKLLEYVFEKPHNFLYLNLLEPVDKMYYKNFNLLTLDDTFT